uniref:RIKEN cDNA 6820408C15 gene n=1 Tax=Mus spicilegus TaxID=10103 RepID=A0A8C6G888_MUSSI
MAQKQTSRPQFSGNKFQVPVRLGPEKNLKPSTLPPLRQVKGRNKSKTKNLNKIQPVQSQVSVEMANSTKTSGGLRRRDQTHHGKVQAKVRLMRSMLRNQRTSLQELYSHEGYLSKLNKELIKAILDTEDSVALSVREMLQQQNILGNIIDILEYSNKKRVQQLRSELQEWKEKEESKTNSLQREVDQLNSEIQKASEEVNFLDTYMDHEYQVKLVQIASHTRQVQQAKDNQQDELDNLSEMRKTILAHFSNVIQEKKKKILKSLVVNTQKPHENILLLKTRDRRRLQRCMVLFRELIEQMKEEIPILLSEVEQMCAELWNPREAVYKDVLLQRPKCTPDMAVELNIPVQEPFPF